jgi:PAS domain S-box-containing protein
MVVASGNSAVVSSLSARRDPVPASLLDAVPCLIAVVDRDSGRLVEVNAALRELLGRCSARPRDTRWEELVAPEDVPLMDAVLVSAGPVSGIETGLRTHDGESRRVLWSLSPAPSDDGADLVVMSGVDVTPELHTTGLFSHLVRTAGAPALVGTDLCGRVTLYNSAAESMLGYPAASMIGKRLDIALFDPAEFAERARRLEVPADLNLLAADLAKLDRRRSNLDLGALDRRRRADDGGSERDRGASQRREGDRRAGRPEDRRAGDGRGGPENRRRARSGAQARDWTLVRRDGERFTASLAVVKVTDAAGATVGHLGVVHDVTEQRKSRNLLVAGLEREAEAVRRLKELDRAKDDFVATVSHELRTPITSILGYVEILLDAGLDEIDPTYVDMLRTVRRNGDRLRTLAEDLLTLSSFESGEFSLNLAEVDLGDVVRRVQEALRPLVADRRLETIFDVPAQPLEVSGDAAHLERVFFNLLSNALKFTEDGGSVRCSLRRDGDDAVLEVSDTGIGIPLEEQEQLFTRFFRSSTAQSRAIQGTGMGLAIVASIVQRHGGTVELTSAEGHGTTVSVHLPVLSR